MEVRRSSESRDELIVDIGIVAGFMTTSYLAMTYGPQFQPTILSSALKAQKYVKAQICEKYLYLSPHLSNVQKLIISTLKSRRHLIRYFVSKTPGYFYPPTPRLHFVSAHNKGGGRWPKYRCEIGGLLSELEEVGEDEGIIVAYAEESSEENESENITESGDKDLLWGSASCTTFHFEPGAHSCSTPKKSDLESDPNETAAKIASLESELQRMKQMFMRFELMIEAQNSDSNYSKNAQNTENLPINQNLGQNNENNVPNSDKIVQNIPGPPPPPPPPMPMLNFNTGENGGVQKIKLRTKAGLSPPPLNLENKKEKILSMSDVLKGLSSVKLKPTPRSPGGTPFKPKKSHNFSSGTDQGALIAAALRKRFTAIQSVSSDENSDSDYENDKENSFTNSKSFQNSKSFTKNEQFDVSLTSKSPVNIFKSSKISVLKSANSSGVAEQKSLLFESPTKNRNSDTSAISSPVGFGQHLLRRRVSSSLQKKQGRLSFTLRDSNESFN